MSQQVHPLISKAVTHIIWSIEFFASLVPKLEFVAITGDRAQQVPTLATDYRHVYYNVEFIENCTLYQVAGCIIHEVLHCAMLHNTRKGTRDPRLWNIACDYAINLIIEDIPNLTLPPGCLLDTQYAGMSAEQIYAKLLEDGGNDTIKIETFTLEGDILDPETSDTDTTMDEQDWKASVAHAANEAKKAGTMPGSLEAFFQPLLKPKLPWRQILENFLNHPVPGNRSWNRMNKRYLPRRIKLPTIRYEQTGDFAMAVDTSGSMSDHMIQIVLNQVAYVVSIIKPKSCMLIQHDADVHEPIYRFQYDDSFPRDINITGRGGTDFRPVFDFVEQEFDELPSALILLTDGYGPWPEQEPEYPVLWILVDSPELEGQIPYGEVAVIDSSTEGY
jgi:predicted metal-dependent peptidase